MLDLPNKLQGKANNPEKINYYRMFFTDGVTDYVRSSGGQVFFAHEADLFQAAKLPFLDFFLDRVCRTVPRLASSETRPLWPAGGGPPGRARGAAPAPGRVSQLSGPGGGAQGGPVRHLPAADGLSGLFKEDAAMLTRYQLILEPDRALCHRPGVGLSPVCRPALPDAGGLWRGAAPERRHPPEPVRLGGEDRRPALDGEPAGGDQRGDLVPPAGGRPIPVSGAGPGGAARHRHPVRLGSTTWTSCSPGPPGRRAATPCAFRPPPPLRAGGSM